MSYSIFIWGIDCEDSKDSKEFRGQISFGLDWWIEHENNKDEISYKIVGQKVINGQKIVCAQKMNKGWCGGQYLGSEQIITKRKIWTDVFSIPRTDSEWLMSIRALPN